MGIQINGNTDIISATDGSLTIQGASGNLTGNLTGTATTAQGLTGTPNITVGTIGATSLNASGVVTATSFSGSGAFLTGIAAFVSGTLMLFQQTAAPTGWTKQTTHNDKTLRVVSGNASSGGTTAFTSVFTSRTPTGSVSGTNSGGSVANTTLSTSQLASHSHSITTNYSFQNGNRVTSSDGSYTNNTAGTNAEGSGSAHGHSFTNPTWSGSFTGSSMDFDVQYVDLIIASKD